MLLMCVFRLKGDLDDATINNNGLLTNPQKKQKKTFRKNEKTNAIKSAYSHEGKLPLGSFSLAILFVFYCIFISYTII